MKIYIASPYTNGDQAANVRVQLEAMHLLMKAGHLPFAPLLSHFAQIVYPKLYNDWMIYDMGWLEACDAVLRLPGESPGADLEVKHAKLLHIPISYNIDDFI